MATTQTKIVDTSTGEEIVRDMNADELAQLKTDQANFKAEKDAQAAKTVEKAALLEKLGITADEAKLLLQ